MECDHFFLVGAPKAATTSIFEYLGQHPEICQSRYKEPGFFGRGVYRKGREYYEREFYPHYSGERVVGEGSTHNLYLPYVPARIAEFYPEAKIIVSLRDPVERAYSNWWMYYSSINNYETLQFRDAVEDELTAIKEVGPRLEDREYWRNIVRVEYSGDAEARRGLDRTYLRRGYYASHLRRYRQHFPDENIKPVFFERFVERPASVIRDIFNFLGVDDTVALDRSVERHRSLNSKAVRNVVELVKRTGVHRLFPQRLIDAYRLGAKPLLSRIGRKPPIDKKIKGRLYDHYCTRNDNLISMLSLQVERIWSPT